jgi:hypothetical protein
MGQRDCQPLLEVGADLVWHARAPGLAHAQRLKAQRSTFCFQR